MHKTHKLKIFASFLRCCSPTEIVKEKSSCLLITNDQIYKREWFYRLPICRIQWIRFLPTKHVIEKHAVYSNYSSQWILLVKLIAIFLLIMQNCKIWMNFITYFTLTFLLIVQHLILASSLCIIFFDRPR